MIKEKQLTKEIKGKIRERIKKLRIINNTLLNLGKNTEYQFNCNVIKGLSISLNIIEKVGQSRLRSAER